jgi:hypothetical protein
MSKLKTEKVFNPSSTVETLTLNSNGSATMAGTVSATERTITTGSWDLATGNFWTCGAITIPTPTNAVAGTGGLIRVTAAPTFPPECKFPGAIYVTPTAFPAIIPFYVQNSTTLLMGNWTEGIA